MIIEKWELIQSVYARYKRWIWYEKEVAKSMLNKLLDKQWITLDQYEDMFCNDEPKDRYVPYMRWYTNLITQVILAYIPEWVQLYEYKTYDYSKHKYVKNFKFKIGDIDYLEIKMAIDIYLNEYKKEQRKQKKALFTAFISTNDLFGKDNPDKTKGRKRKPLSNEEKLAIRQMMWSMNRVQIRKWLEHK